MASVTIKINQSGNILLFKHMNRVIVDSYKRKGIIPSLSDHKKLFEHTHGVEIILDNGNWSHMKFSNEQDYLMAVLKWQ